MHQPSLLLIASCVGAFTAAGVHAQTPEFQIAGHTAASVFKAPHLSELANAACRGDSAGVRSAAKAGADINGLSIDGGTPLLWAVYCDDPKGVSALLEAGADPNLKARGKYSPTFAAATASKPDVLRVLLKNGGDPNTDDGESWTALGWAFLVGKEKGRWENYYSLLDAGADIDRLGPLRRTIAVEAAFAGRFDKVEELLVRGYSRDLQYLGAATQNHVLAAKDPQNAYRAKVLSELAEKGVSFPVPPLHRGMQ